MVLQLTSKCGVLFAKRMLDAACLRYGKMCAKLSQNFFHFEGHSTFYATVVLPMTQEFSAVNAMREDQTYPSNTVHVNLEASIESRLPDADTTFDICYTNPQCNKFVSEGRHVSLWLNCETRVQ